MAPDRTSPLSGGTLLTLSFAGDLAPCRLLCETVDRFVGPEFDHVVAVPRADLPLFADLATARRRIILQESLLPGWLHKLPLPGPAWRKRLFLPRRNVYVSRRGLPVRGWIAQQIMKLTAAARADTELVLHVDSDAAFVRRLRLSDLTRGGAARLLRLPGKGDTPMHRRWHASASRLLGIAATDYHGADYIDNLTTWRRSTVRRLLAHLETVAGVEAAQALARTKDFSEYILYGVYCDKVLGIAAAGHAADARALCSTVWTHAPSGIGEAIAALEPHQVAIGIQSTIPISDAERRAIVATATRAAAAQDAAVPGAA